MKITSVECYLGKFITIKINTDEGIYGWGEAGLAYGNSFEAAFGQCQDFAKLIIGMDPFDTEKIWPLGLIPDRNGKAMSSSGTWMM